MHKSLGKLLRLNTNHPMPALNPPAEPLLEKYSLTPAIGVFDSGVGGLTVLRHIHTALPHENLLYFADSANAPYGSKSPEYIVSRAREVSQAFIKEGVKAIVVACNTATAAAIKTLRQEFNLPILGMEPAVKPATAATRNGIVGVLATTGTLKSAQFAALLENYGQNTKVVTQACVGLVELIERGELHTQATRTLLLRYIEPLIQSGADTIVLGCTHYPFVASLIAEIAGRDVKLIETGSAVAKQLSKRLQEEGLLSEDASPGIVRLMTNGNRESEHVLQRLWAELQDQ